MRLLHTVTLCLETFDGIQCPQYAILSHTWGDDEVLFEHIGKLGSRMSNVRKIDWRDKIDLWIAKLGQLIGLWRMGESDARRKSWKKIITACEKARENEPPLDYIWIDTCCIDKTSSTELSEALNSMFRWYHGATVCYAYLEGVECTGLTAELVKDSIKDARWFKRGWTLQELIAPVNVIFYSSTWEVIGTKDSLCDILSQITSINTEVLRDPRLLSSTSVARRMSWAADRKTERLEDIAYCLMGIFDVNMPLLYGEGRKAFIRLQEEIIKDTEDQSLFAWQWLIESSKEEDLKDLANEGVFAHHPAAFRDSFNIVPYWTTQTPYKMTNRGLEIHMPVTEVFRGEGDELPKLYGILSCYSKIDYLPVAIMLERSTDRYYRPNHSPLTPIPDEDAELTDRSLVHIHKYGARKPQVPRSPHCRIGAFPSHFHFSDGIAVAAVTCPVEERSDNAWMLHTSSTEWSSIAKTVTLSPGCEGHFGALDFTMARGIEIDREVTQSCIVVVRLFPHDFGIIIAILRDEQDLGTDQSLRTVLEEHHKTPASTQCHVIISNGSLKICLRKQDRYNVESYIMDIEYQPRALTLSADLLLPRLPDLRFIELED